MDKIELSITNPNNNDYPRVVLRKFFYMVFIDANGRKLYAYIASVFGGVITETDDPDFAYKNIRYKSKTDCTLQFEFKSDTGIIKKINVSNITSSFFQQTEDIEKVWGKCEVLENQEAVDKSLRELYPELYPSSNPKTTTDVAHDKTIIIKDKDSRSSHNCIVKPGVYDSTEGQQEPVNVRKKYLLSFQVPQEDSRLDGLEAMNWIKVEIDLKRNILEKHISFSIMLAKGKIFTPDFTWYFAPPLGTVISADSYVKIGNKRVNNVIQSVSDETTVYFDEWSDPPESISESKKSRVLFKSDEINKIVNQYSHCKLSEYELLTVVLHLENPQKPSNRQFIIGLFVAFLLAFCSDKTRINDFYTCLHSSCTCPVNICNCRTICDSITVVAPVLLIISFISFILSPQKVLPADHKERKRVAKKEEHGSIFDSVINKVSSFRNCFRFFAMLLRFLGMFSTFCLIFYVFGLWLIFPEFMRSIISCQLNFSILKIGAIFSFIINMIYCIYCTMFLKRKIFNYL